MKFLLNKYQIILEQGTMALLNFCLIFVLSKIVPANLFKDFFLGYSVVIIITLVISSFANQHLQVFLRGKNNKSYFYKVFLMNLLFLLITSIICVIVISNFYYFLINSLPYIITLAFVTSIYDAIRRVSFVYFQNKFSANLLATTSVLFFFFIMIFFFYTIGDLSVRNIYTSLIISYLFGIFIFIFFQIKKIKTFLFQKGESKNKTFVEVFKKHYSYASWLVIGVFFFWTYTQGIYFVAEKYLTLEDFNAVRISQNLVGVLSVLFVTFENMMLVKMSLIFEQKKLAGINEFVEKLLKKLMLPFILILIVSYLVMTQLYKLYYQGNSFYSEKITYVLYFFLYQFLFGLSRTFVVALKAINATKYILYSHILTAIFTLLLAQLLFLKFNNGLILIFIMICSMLVFSAGIYFFYRKIIKKI